MSIGAYARGLATASLVAMAVIGYQAAPAHAAKNNPQNKSASTCIAQGYQWDDVKGCADKKCDNPEASGYHGDYYFGLHNVFICDGFSGNWVAVRTTTPGESGPVAPRPTTNQRVP